MESQLKSSIASPTSLENKESVSPINSDTSNLQSSTPILAPPSIDKNSGTIYSSILQLNISNFSNIYRTSITN